MIRYLHLEFVDFSLTICHHVWFRMYMHGSGAFVSIRIPYVQRIGLHPSLFLSKGSV